MVKPASDRKARRRAREQQVRTLRNYARLARLRYDEGYASYLEVLDAERSLFDAELALTASRNALFRALIDVYKAMGGGWIEQAGEGRLLKCLEDNEAKLSDSCRGASQDVGLK